MNTPQQPPADDAAIAVSLDTLFRSNARARPSAVALLDPPDRTSFTDGAPLPLTYAEADAVVERLAHRLRALGLPPGSVVAVQLPNIVEAVLTLLAILRAGFVAAPVPMAWRRSELVAALSGVEPKVLITVARFGEDRPAEVACQAAFELFSLSFPCAFGAVVPDGVIALDADDGTATVKAPTQPSQADQAAILTFDATAEGFFAAARGHSQWLALGLAVLLEAKIESGDTIVSTLPPNSLIGIGAAVVPWLLSGGALALRRGPAPAASATAVASSKTHLIAPAPVLMEVAHRWSAPFASCVAVRRSQHGHTWDYNGLQSHEIVDLHGFGELGAVALRRKDRSQARRIPLGPISAPSESGGAPVVIETKVEHGELLLRGPMLPRSFHRSGETISSYANSGFARPGYRCHADADGLDVTDGPRRVAAVGGLRFGLDDLAIRVAKSTGAAKVDAIGDQLLGERLHIEVENPETAAVALQAEGHSRLVIEALVAAAPRRRAIG
jgi:acyl-CoA synthetase (AMP-forming)/AMP-acid ligase II